MRSVAIVCNALLTVLTGWVTSAEPESNSTELRTTPYNTSGMSEVWINGFWVCADEQPVLAEPTNQRVVFFGKR